MVVLLVNGFTFKHGLDDGLLLGKMLKTKYNFQMLHSYRCYIMYSNNIHTAISREFFFYRDQNPKHTALILILVL